MSEFKNGEKVWISSPNKTWTVIGTNPQTGSIVCLLDGYCDRFNSFHASQLKRPMSDEEKAAKDIYDLYAECWGGVSLHEWNDAPPITKKVWIELAKRVTITK